MNTYDQYKDVVLEYAALFKENEITRMDDDAFIYLSEILSVDKASLEESYQKGVFPKRLDSRYYMFSNYVWQYEIEKTMLNIKKDYSYQSLINNYEDYLCIVQCLGTITSNITVYCSLKEGYYTDETNLISYGESFISSIYLKALQFFRNKEIFDRSHEYLPLIYTLLDYEIECYRNLVFFINALLLIAESEKLDKPLCCVASRLLDRLFLLFRDTSVASCVINSVYHDLKIPAHERGRINQTTLLQVVYYYRNTDVYALRLDLPHQGVEYIHFNNISPGNTKCYLFSEAEYAELIDQYPQMERCFIGYSGGRYVLKERINCPQEGDIMSVYDELCKRYDHNTAFSERIAEETMVELFDLLHYLLPDTYYQKLDDNESNPVNKCFNYVNIMGVKGLASLYLTITDGNNKRKIIDNILERAVNCDIIRETEKEDYRSIEGVCIIAELAREYAHER